MTEEKIKLLLYYVNVIATIIDTPFEDVLQCLVVGLSEGDQADVLSSAERTNRPRTISSEGIVGPDWQPPVGGMGGSIHAWERGLSGWYATDWCGNQIGFIEDGTAWPITKVES